MANIPEAQQIYKHFKGNLYRVVTIAEHSETGEALVIYQALYGEYKIYARPLSSFTEKVDKIKYPNAEQTYRFELQRGLMSANVVMPPANEHDTKEYLSEEQDTEVTDQEPVAKQQTSVLTVEETTDEECNLDPLVIEFLDSDTYEGRLNALTGLHHRITDDMINTMAVAADVEVKEGELEDRYEELKNCLLTLNKYECNRLR